MNPSPNATSNHSKHDSSKRARRAEPITKRTSKDGSISYEFRADVGSKPDGSRDRRRFTYRTLTEAKREYRRITTEITIDVYARKSTLTVAEACDEWLAGRRGIRSVTLQGYRHDLAVVKRFLGGRKLQQLTKADGDALVDYMLTSGRRSRRCYQPGSLAGRVIEQISAHPGGISAADLVAAFPNEDVHTCLSGLKRAKRVARPSRGIYVIQDSEAENTSNAGVKPITVRSTLTTFGMVIQSFVDQGTLSRNVIALVERPADPLVEDKPATAKSWTLAEVDEFRKSVRDERLFACWLLRCYGLRRSEVLGIRWSALEGDTLSIRRSRVLVGSDSVEGMPKSRRSLRELPLPPELSAALGKLNAQQQEETRVAGNAWSDDRLIAVRADGTPIPMSGTPMSSSDYVPEPACVVST